MKTCFIGLLLLVTGCERAVEQKSASEKHSAAVAPLHFAGTLWTSDFYHYHNRYRFLDDSTGYSLDGQYAWSCPVDTAALGISGNTVLYGERNRFRYTLKDTTLTITYLEREGDSPPDTRIFYLDTTNGRRAFLSDHEYAYGKELLLFMKEIGR